MPASVTSWISSRPATTVVELLERLGDESLVVRPAAVLLARVPRELPVDVGGVMAEHVADAGSVELGRGAPDHVEVDVDRLRDGPGQADFEALVTQRRAVGERGIRAHRRRDLEERPAAPPGEELGDVERAPTAQADDRPELRQPGDLFVERRDLDRRDLVDGGEMAVEVVLEPRPQVGHRHDDIGAMDEVRQLLDQLPTEDGREAGVDHLRPQLDGGHGRVPARVGMTSGPRLARRDSSAASDRSAESRPPLLRRVSGRRSWSGLTISLDVSASSEP